MERIYGTDKGGGSDRSGAVYHGESVEISRLAEVIETDVKTNEKDFEKNGGAL